MAAECRMSPRTFLRRFAEATGATPSDWLTMERVAAAKELLSQGEASIDDIAASVGFGSAHTLRHHFRQKIGISPAKYRRRFLVETVIQPI